MVKEPEGEASLEDQVRFEIRDGVAWITINRPDRGNSITPACRDRIRDLVRGLNGGFDARAVVLTASGHRHFCTGADISESRVYPDRPADAPPPGRVVGEPRRMMLEGQLQLIPALLDSELPIIAAVNGTAAGVGVHIALACDLVLMADTAKLIEIFARRGLVPDALGTWMLPRLVGPHKAKELFFFADDVPADEAMRLGLCNRVVAAAELAGVAGEWAGRLASGPSKTHMLSKWLVNQSFDSDRQTMAEYEAWAVEANSRTNDAGEGVASFRERREPEWRGW